MFEQIKVAEAAEKPGIKEFLILYAQFQAGARWLADRQAKGLDNTARLPDFRRLEAQIDAAWDICMSKTQKDEIIALLAQNRAIPEEVCQAKEMFTGQLVKLT